MKREAIQQFFNVFSKTFKTALKQELSDKSEDIIARERYRENITKGSQLGRAQSEGKKAEINSKAPLTNDQLLEAGLKKKKERLKSWGAYKAFGPVMAGGAVIGTSLLPGLGTVIGAAAGAITGLGAGLLVQQIAFKIGIPTIKAFKRALRDGKEAYNKKANAIEVKQEYTISRPMSITPQSSNSNLQGVAPAVNINTATVNRRTPAKRPNPSLDLSSPEQTRPLKRLRMSKTII